jgi:hypothetical protein
METIMPKTARRKRTAMPWFVKIEEGIVDKVSFDRHVPAKWAISVLGLRCC